MTLKAETKQQEKQKHQIDLKCIRDMIGEWEVGPIYSMSGESQSGKTTLALQLAAEYSHKYNKKLCLYDTEGGGQKFLDAWMPVHQDMYPKAEAVCRSGIRTWQRILADHGIGTGTEISDKGKFKVTMSGHAEKSNMAKFVEEENIGIIIYDSVTMPMQGFGVNQENFPVRNSVQQAWFTKMIELIDDHQILVIITNHVTKNPTIPYATPKLAGGKAIHHNSKVQFYIKRWEAKGISDYRTVKLDRYYDVGKDTKSGYVLLTNDGYVDRTREEFEADKKKGRAS